MVAVRALMDTPIPTDWFIVFGVGTLLGLLFLRLTGVKRG